MTKVAASETALSVFRSGAPPERSQGANWKLGAVLMLAAGALYSLHLGRTLGASEAYTAMAVDQPSYAGVIQAALRFDQCKPPLYQILLHTLVLVFGSSETVLRAPSVIFAVVSVGMVLALGSRMFSPAVGVAAALVWALSPVAIIYGGWARMYAMMVAVALLQFLLLWRLLSRESGGLLTIACGALGAAMLYTHLGNVLFLAAEAAMLMGTTLRGERNRAAWAALLLAAVAFVPFVPIATSQLSQYVYGHWVDWIGPAHQTSPVRKAAAFLSTAIIAAALTFGPRLEADEREPLRWCAGIGLLPIAALVAGSIVLRPMFAIRYVAPSVAMLVLLLAAVLASLGMKWFRLTTFGIAAFLVFLFPHYQWCDPWRDMARIVAGGSSAEPVFFESGYVGSTAAETNPEKGFPQGFFRVPFERYFSGPNPRLVVAPSAPAAARQTIGSAAAANRGAWLVTGFGADKARAELPANCFRVEKKVACDYAALYHVAPIPGCNSPAER